MNFFDFILLLLPILYGVAKFTQDLNRDERFESPLRKVFLGLGLRWFWDDDRGGGDEADVWHYADKTRTAITWTYPFWFFFSGFNASFEPSAWSGLALLGYAALAWYVEAIVFFLGYHHVFAPRARRYPYKNLFKFMLNPFSDAYRPTNETPDKKTAAKA